MIVQERWRALGWRHTVWDLVRYYCSLRRASREQKSWLDELRGCLRMRVGDSKYLPVAEEDIKAFLGYLDDRRIMTERALCLLRTEEEALAYCKASGFAVGKVRTKNQDHHQSAKAIIATVTSIAEQVCKKKKSTLDPNPQSRCAWCAENGLHVTARNLDGAIPALANPTIIWEIKEYWGVTSGGSKMSDAVYECNLVGRELREFEERTKLPRVQHVVLLDGKEQWLTRKSDLTRFVDLLCQGIIDQLFVGKEIESQWSRFLKDTL